VYIIFKPFFYQWLKITGQTAKFYDPSLINFSLLNF